MSILNDSYKICQLKSVFFKNEKKGAAGAAPFETEGMSSGLFFPVDRNHPDAGRQYDR
jgi:hypothetical protein